MRKFINDPENVSEELIEGFCITNKDKVKMITPHAVARIEAPVKDKVGILIGGGSGHEPLFLEFIGSGMADVVAHGNIFAAPDPETIYQGIKACDSGNGVILLYNNYAGDVLNFNMAQDMARDEGILVDTVLINDEISAFPVEQMEQRRGTTADHVIIKIAGTAAESGLGFQEIRELLKKAIYNSRSLGVSSSACTLPQTGKATFELPEGKIEFGMGLHGEAGVKRVPMMTADETAVHLLDLILADLPFERGDEVIALVNGYGSTTRMEMFIMMRKIHAYLNEMGISVYSSELGEFCTAQEMAGVSVTLTRLDDDIKKFYDGPADSPGYKKH